MFSNKMDFSSCVIWIDFHKSGHILRLRKKNRLIPKLPVPVEKRPQSSVLSTLSSGAVPSEMQ